jgi:hypothetical protein
MSNFNTLATIRLLSHQPFIETGRHRNIDRNIRKCQLCQCYVIEDEFHFELICSAYTTLKKQCIPRYYYTRPSMLTYTELLQCTNANILNKLANSCKKAFDFLKEFTKRLKKTYKINSCTKIYSNIPVY